MQVDWFVSSSHYRQWNVCFPVFLQSVVCELGASYFLATQVKRRDSIEFKPLSVAYMELFSSETYKSVMLIILVSRVSINIDFTNIYFQLPGNYFTGDIFKNKSF